MTFNILKIDPEDVQSVSRELMVGSHVVAKIKDYTTPLDIVSTSLNPTLYLIDGGWKKFWIKPQNIIEIIAKIN